MQLLTVNAVVPWISVLLLVFFSLSVSWIRVRRMSLLEWQRLHFGWNYIGSLFNYVAVIAVLFAGQVRFAELGIRWGKWSIDPVGVSCFTLLFFGSVIVLSNYQSTKRLLIHFPGWSTLLFQGIYIPIGEELFWRGYLQQSVGLWLSVVAFGLLHALNDGPVHKRFAGALYAGVLGLVFGVLRLTTGGIVAGVILHGALNVINHVTYTGIPKDVVVPREPSEVS